MYLSIGTRPDIAHAVSIVSQFNDCHNETHWSAIKKVLRYLKGTANHGLLYKQNNDKLRGFVDADWANCPKDRKSYTGFAFILGDAAESRKLGIT